MFLAQARTTPGLQAAAVADLNVPRARAQLASACWPQAQYGARSVDEAVRSGVTLPPDRELRLVALAVAFIAVIAGVAAVVGIYSR